MKKIFMVLLAVFVLAVVNPTKSEAKVMYDGAEVVKGQTGKMTFKKDIKVYKKNPDDTFSSLVVKRNNFFRTYDIEKYDGKTFYQMGQYRVQATDLVVFKEVPIKIRASFYNKPTYLMINHDSEMGTYGSYFYEGIRFPDNGQVDKCYGDGGEGEFCDRYLGTDFKIVEWIPRDAYVRYEIVADIRAQRSPIRGDFYSGEDALLFEKGSTFLSRGVELNGHLSVDSESNNYWTWIPVELLKPVK